MVKVMITTPINPKNSNMKSNEELILIRFDFDDNNRFTNLHYLQNLIYIYEDNIHYTHQNNNHQLLTSKEAMIEFKFKIEKILNEFNKKLKVILDNQSALDSNMRQNLPWIKQLNYKFEFSELFYKNTSFKMIELCVRLLTEMIDIFVNKSEDLYLQYETETMKSDVSKMYKSPKKYMSNQQYLIYFFELLLSADENLNILIRNEKFDSLCLSNKKFYKEFFNLKEILTQRINKVVLKNFKENFLILYGENIRNKIQEYI
jgi:hypothetical protein